MTERSIDISTLFSEKDLRELKMTIDQAREDPDPRHVVEDIFGEVVFQQKPKSKRS